MLRASFERRPDVAPTGAQEVIPCPDFPMAGSPWAKRPRPLCGLSGTSVR